MHKPFHTAFVKCSKVAVAWTRDQAESRSGTVRRTMATMFALSLIVAGAAAQSVQVDPGDQNDGTVQKNALQFGKPAAFQLPPSGTLLFRPPNTGISSNRSSSTNGVTIFPEPRAL